MEPFEGPRLKITRAAKHIAELEAVVSDYGARVKVGYREDLAGLPDQPEGMVCWRIEFSERPPSEIPAIIGDAAHNLRASLDVMLCDIARYRDRRVDKVYFPIGSDEVQFEKVVRKVVSPIGSDVADEVRKTKAYSGGNTDLKGLHELDILDKHRLVIPNYLIQPGHSQLGVTLPNEDGRRLIEELERDLAAFAVPMSEGEAALCAEGVSPFAHFQFVGGPIPYLPQDLPFRRRSAVTILHQLLRQTSGTIEHFAALFGPPN